MLTGTCLKYTAPNAQQARDLRDTRIPRCARGGQKEGAQNGRLDHDRVAAD